MVQELDSLACAELIQNKDLCIIDVRTNDEFILSRIPGAINIDIMTSNAIEALANLEKKTPYLIYCEVGVRSRSTIKIMEAMGFMVLYQLTNGLAQYMGPIDDTIFAIV